MAVTVVILLAADAALRTWLSRAVIAVFAVLAAGSISAFRIAGRGFLGHLRRKGYNLRYLVVVGAGDLAAETIDSIHGHPEAGLRVLGVLSNDPAATGQTIQGVRVVGDYTSVKQQLQRHRVDQVVIALPKEDSGYLEKILADLDDEIVTVRLIPDLLHVMTLRSSVEDLDGLPVINLRESPMVGWAGIQKRIFDVAATSAVLLVAAPMMALIAVALWITSGRPILFAQERMGLDGRVFRMLKFRTMPIDAESETGPVWNTAGRRARHAPGIAAPQDEPGRAPAALERPARGHEPGGTEAGTAGVHRRVPPRDPGLHAPAQGEGRAHGLGSGARLARQHLAPRARRARHLLHPELDARARHPDPAADPVARLAPAATPTDGCCRLS